MSGRPGRRPAAALAMWLAIVAVAVLALHRAGRGELATPPIADPAGWVHWLEGRDPVVAAMAVVRLGALAAVWYLLIASLAGLTLRFVRADGLVAVTDRLTVPAVRRLLVAAAGVTLASGVSPQWAGAQSGGPSLTETTTSVPDVHPAPTLTMRLLPPGDVAPAPAAVPSTASPGAATSTWTVRPGECFWSIAEDVLTRAWGRAPTDAEIVPYWRTVIERNRASLADPANEDLIFPGQVFSLPEPPSAR